MALMYLSEENFTCPKGQLMHKQLSLVATVLIPDINSIENRSQLIRTCTVFQTTCKFKIINPIFLKHMIKLTLFILVPGQVNRNF